MSKRAYRLMVGVVLAANVAIPAQNDSRESAQTREDLRKVESSPEFQEEKGRMIRQIKEIETSPEMMSLRAAAERCIREAEANPDVYWQKIVMQEEIRRAEVKPERQVHSEKIEREAIRLSFGAKQTVK